MVAHASLTGSDLHEVKGADTATAGQILIADGAGSADWSRNAVDFVGFSAYDTTTQTAPASGVKKAITYDTQIHAESITHTPGGSEITIDVTGFYELVVLPQFVTGGGGAGTMEISWERNTGSGFVTIGGSPVREIMAASSERVVPCVIALALNDGDVIRAGWATNSASVNLIGSTPLITGDTIPSVQVYVTLQGT